eukprot:gb/GEZN01020765.1/.p1 GENE.gb/GEZN01020765.1/~~gb/GEZN01020765.1/.p1  ORF type:complete len:133 (+),score=47.32 gb/GEZN01020765.1/:135-533(+)
MQASLLGRSSFSSSSSCTSSSSSSSSSSCSSSFSSSSSSSSSSSTFMAQDLRPVTALALGLSCRGRDIGCLYMSSDVYTLRDVGTSLSRRTASLIRLGMKTSGALFSVTAVISLICSVVSCCVSRKFLSKPA